MKIILLISTVITSAFLFSSYKKSENTWQNSIVSPCTLNISSINDTVFVISGSSTFTLEKNIMLGTASILSNNDTITITGNNYSVALFAYDNNGCSAQKVITKFN